MKLRIAAVQLNSILGNVEENMSKALKMLEQTFPSSKPKPDLVVLPELALTGYNFKSPAHIHPFLEKAGNGKSYQFGKMISERWECLTLLGYPEKYDKANEEIIYNSAMLIDAKGKLIHNYRKTHLYETDKIWGCKESPDGFQAFDVPFNGEKIRTTIGICMDLNPYEFTAPFEKYEFSRFASDNKCQLILIPTAWMNSNWKENWTLEQANEFHKIYQNTKLEPVINDEHNHVKDHSILIPQVSIKLAKDYRLEEVDGSTGRYWVMRLNPLYSETHDFKQVVVVCNRSGMEDKLMYGGTSTMYTFFGGPMERTPQGLSIDFNVEGSLGQGTEGVLVREVEI